MSKGDKARPFVKPGMIPPSLSIRLPLPANLHQCRPKLLISTACATAPLAHVITSPGLLQQPKCVPAASLALLSSVQPCTGYSFYNISSIISFLCTKSLDPHSTQNQSKNALARKRVFGDLAPLTSAIPLSDHFCAPKRNHFSYSLSHWTCAHAALHAWNRLLPSYGCFPQPQNRRSSTFLHAIISMIIIAPSQQNPSFLLASGSSTMNGIEWALDTYLWL